MGLSEEEEQDVLLIFHLPLTPPQSHSLLCSVPWGSWKRLCPLLSGTQPDSSSGKTPRGDWSMEEQRSHLVLHFLACPSRLAPQAAPPPLAQPSPSRGITVLSLVVTTLGWLPLPAAAGLRVPQLPLCAPPMSRPHFCMQPLH